MLRPLPLAVNSPISAARNPSNLPATGNFPQAFSHLALIKAPARMIVPELAHF
jgi:hypothetical protein